MSRTRNRRPPPGKIQLALESVLAEERAVNDAQKADISALEKRIGELRTERDAERAARIAAQGEVSSLTSHLYQGGESLRIMGAENTRLETMLREVRENAAAAADAAAKEWRAQDATNGRLSEQLAGNMEQLAREAGENTRQREEFERKDKYAAAQWKAACDLAHDLRATNTRLQKERDEFEAAHVAAQARWDKLLDEREAENTRLQGEMQDAEGAAAEQAEESRRAWAAYDEQKAENTRHLLLLAQLVDALSANECDNCATGYDVEHWACVECAGIRAAMADAWKATRAVRNAPPPTSDKPTNCKPAAGPSTAADTRVAWAASLPPLPCPHGCGVTGPHEHLGRYTDPLAELEAKGGAK